MSLWYGGKLYRLQMLVALYKQFLYIVVDIAEKKMYRIGMKVHSRQRINDESESRVWLYYTTAQWLMDHCTLCTKTMFYYWTTIIYSHESSYKAEWLKKNKKTLCCSSCFYSLPRYMLHVCTSIYRLIEKPVEFDRLRF